MDRVKYRRGLTISNFTFEDGVEPTLSRSSTKFIIALQAESTSSDARPIAT